MPSRTSLISPIFTSLMPASVLFARHHIDRFARTGHRRGPSGDRSGESEGDRWTSGRFGGG